jgi:ribonuclease III
MPMYDLLEQRIGHRFRRPELLREALTHRSSGSPNNERLEFLGDGILNAATGALLTARYPEADEGDLSRMRATLVNRDMLHEVALELELGPCIALGEGEQRNGGAARPSILADALEAVCGAAFLDGGWEVAFALVRRWLGGRMESLDDRGGLKDPKTALQEVLQGRRLGLPEYRVVSVEGQAHDQAFCVECRVPALGLAARGSGTSRRRAEQEAAAAVGRMIQSSAASP